MLEWTAAGKGPASGALSITQMLRANGLYDRNTHIGKLVKALEEARAKGWAVVDIKTDWARIFAFQR